jgi:hypothetical protein
MDLVLFESQGPEFVVVSRDRGDKFGGFGGTLGIRPGSLASPWAVAIRHLRYRKDPLGITFRPLPAGHRREQAQIVVFDGESATPWPEVADGAMPVQDKRWRLPAAPSSPDCVDGLSRPDNVVRNPHGSVTVSIAVDHGSCVCQYPGGLRQR